MNRNKQQIIDRAKYVQETINSRPKGEKFLTVVNDIAEKLFLSPSTIMKDYTREIPDQSRQSGR